MACLKSRDGRHSVCERDGCLVCFFCNTPFPDGWNDVVPVRSGNIILSVDKLFKLHKDVKELRARLTVDDDIFRRFELKVFDEFIDSLLMDGDGFVERRLDKVRLWSNQLSLKDALKKDLED